MHVVTFLDVCVWYVVFACVLRTWAHDMRVLAYVYEYVACVCGYVACVYGYALLT